MTDEILSPDNVRIIVPGAMMTDIEVAGLPHLPVAGQDTYGSSISIGGGGKSRNIAEMAGRLTRPGTVACITYTAKDPYGLWEPPFNALINAGVNTRYVLIDDNVNGQAMPAISLISVDQYGNRQSSISTGVSNLISPSVIQAAEQLFTAAESHFGFLTLSMEMPFETVVFATQLARQHKMHILLDPGGIQPNDDYPLVTNDGVYLIKPNEKEAERLTGVIVTDITTAEQAANILRQKGAANVLITHGEHGAYLFGENDLKLHIPIPTITATGPTDATGCGDQTLATLAVCLTEGRLLEEAAKIAVVAGTLQFHRLGIKPVLWEEISQITPITAV